MASIRPENPPIVNSTTKAMANSIGVSKVMAPRHIVLTQLKTFTPVGTAISIVAYMKNSSPVSGMPTVNMWWAQTMKLRNAIAAIAFLSFIVWAHHMFTVGMPLGGEIYFMFATMLISVPTGVKVFNWVTTMWRGSISFETPMLWAIAFVILFTIGGFSGLMLAIVPADYQYHDTYFVVAHFHYVLVTGALFGIIAAVYYWWPKWTGRMYSETMGKIHFWWTMVFVNLLFFPQHFLGLAGMPRRIPDYNVVFADWNLISSIGAFGMFVTPFFMAFVLWRSLKTGAKAEARAWEGARGLEWTVPSPAPHHTFTVPPVIRPGDLAHGDITH